MAGRKIERSLSCKTNGLVHSGRTSQTSEWTLRLTAHKYENVRRNKPVLRFDIHQKCSTGHSTSVSMNYQFQHRMQSWPHVLARLRHWNLLLLVDYWTIQSEKSVRKAHGQWILSQNFWRLIVLHDCNRTWPSWPNSLFSEKKSIWGFFQFCQISPVIECLNDIRI